MQIIYFSINPTRFFKDSKKRTISVLHLLHLSVKKLINKAKIAWIKFTYTLQFVVHRVGSVKTSNYVTTSEHHLKTLASHLM